MVFACTCELANTAFIFASTSSDQICLASIEHFKKSRWRVFRTSGQGTTCIEDTPGK